MLNGLSIRLKVVGDDVICSYDGLSFSGPNVFIYSTKWNRYMFYSGNLYKQTALADSKISEESTPTRVNRKS
jgi:hypothetical protein